MQIMVVKRTAMEQQLRSYFTMFSTSALTIENLDDFYINFWCFLPQFLNLGNEINFFRFAFLMTLVCKPTHKQR